MKESDKCKLIFFTLDGSKKAYKVLPFGSKNAPSFYAALMRNLQLEWNLLYRNDVTVDKPTPPGYLNITIRSNASRVQ